MIGAKMAAEKHWTVVRMGWRAAVLTFRMPKTVKVYGAGNTDGEEPQRK